jgi:hypothetical protein
MMIIIRIMINSMTINIRRKRTNHDPGMGFWLGAICSSKPFKTKTIHMLGHVKATNATRSYGAGGHATW